MSDCRADRTHRGKATVVVQWRAEKGSNIMATARRFGYVPTNVKRCSLIATGT